MFEGSGKQCLTDVMSGPGRASGRLLVSWCCLGKSLLIGRNLSDALVVSVGRANLSIGVALVVETLLRLRLALLVLLAVAAKPRKRHRSKPLLGDLQAARLANPVVAFVQTLERVVNLLQLYPFAIGEDEIDFAIALFGREIVSIHALVLVVLAFGAQFRVDF